mgnify:CR=1 FL=1
MYQHALSVLSIPEKLCANIHTSVSILRVIDGFFPLFTIITTTCLAQDRTDTAQAADSRDKAYQEQGDYHCRKNRNNIFSNPLNLYAADTAAHEQAGTYRWCYGADTKVHNQHKSEMHRTHSNAGGDWKEDWSEDQHGRSQIQKHTHHQQEHIHD